MVRYLAAADEDAEWETMVDAWVDSEAFGETIKDMHAELFLVRADVIEPLPSVGPLAGELMSDMSTSLAEDPLELVRSIVMEDRPYTELVDRK